MRGRSVFTNLVPFLDRLYKNLDSKSNDLSVFYSDFPKAFDKVPHKLFTAKLKIYGIKGKLMEILCSYFANRKQYVRCDGSKSSLLEVFSGVLQGSILGPLFLGLFINDLPTVFHKATPYVFADDLKLFDTDSKELQDDLDLVEEWVSLNGMELAIKKCFHFRLSKVSTLLMFYGTPLKQVSVVRDLGIHIRSELSGHHIQIRLNKLNSAFWMFRRSLPERVHWHAKLCLYKSAILPIITFGSMCFS